MTGDTRFDGKIGQAATKFKLSRSLRTAAILAGLFVSASFFAAPVSVQVSEKRDTQKIEVFDGRQAVANEVLVKFRESATAESLAQVQQDGDFDSDEELGSIGVHLFHSRSKDVTTLVRELSSRADVAYAEPNYILHADLTVPNDPSFSSLWGLRNTGQVIGGQAGTPGAHQRDSSLGHLNR